MGSGENGSQREYLEGRPALTKDSTWVRFENLVETPALLLIVHPEDSIYAWRQFDFVDGLDSMSTKLNFKAYDRGRNYAQNKWDIVPKPVIVQTLSGYSKGEYDIEVQVDALDMQGSGNLIVTAVDDNSVDMAFTVLFIGEEIEGEPQELSVEFSFAQVQLKSGTNNVINFNQNIDASVRVNDREPFELKGVPLDGSLRSYTTIRMTLKIDLTIEGEEVALEVIALGEKK